MRWEFSSLRDNVGVGIVADTIPSVSRLEVWYNVSQQPVLAMEVAILHYTKQHHSGLQGLTCQFLRLPHEAGGLLSGLQVSVRVWRAQRLRAKPGADYKP